MDPLSTMANITQALRHQRSLPCQSTPVMYNYQCADLTTQLAGAQLTDIIILLKIRLKRAVLSYPLSVPLAAIPW